MKNKMLIKFTMMTLRILGAAVIAPVSFLGGLVVTYHPTVFTTILGIAVLVGGINILTSERYWGKGKV